MADPCLGCSRLELPDAPVVVLLTGQTVCTSCEAWRLECLDRDREAAALLDLPDRPARLARLDALERQHGAEYRRRLEAVVLRKWEARRAARAAATT